MSSPRKYSSPYLTGLPGLPNTPSTNKVKKRSKTSITKPNPSAVHPDHIETSSNIQLSDQDQVGFDQSSGDVDKNALEDIKGAAKVIHLSPSPESSEGKQQEDPEENCYGTPTPDMDTAVVNDTESNDNNGNPTEEPTVQEHPLKTVTVSLKSILKTPTPAHHKQKSKPFKPDVNVEGLKSLAGVNVKGTKVKSAKLGGGNKEKEQPGRSLTNNKHKPAASMSKIDVFHQQQTQPATKSPRRRSKVTQGKPSDKAGGGIPLQPKKSVRFSNRIEVHAVPYEARAGSRACDWQRNMLEQRVQSFRQLMKDVGSEEIDMFGSGVVFPGYPYPLPYPSFASRGRVRNFKF